MWAKIKPWLIKAGMAILTALGAVTLWRVFGSRAGLSKGVGVDNNTSISGWQKASGDAEKPTVTAPLGKEAIDEEISRIDSELDRRK